jgi:hypothetical protein
MFDINTLANRYFDMGKIEKENKFEPFINNTIKVVQAKNYISIAQFFDILENEELDRLVDLIQRVIKYKYKTQNMKNIETLGVLTCTLLTAQGQDITEDNILEAIGSLRVLCEIEKKIRSNEWIMDRTKWTLNRKDFMSENVQVL